MYATVARWSCASEKTQNTGKQIEFLVMEYWKIMGGDEQLKQTQLVSLCL